MNTHLTLIELLVVITIIVVLLALLTPALDKAVYQAQLAVCGSNLDGVTMAVSTYAAQYKRMYPVRIGAAWPQQLVNTPNKDDRPLLRQYMSINNQLLCPLSGDVNLEDYTKDAANRMVMTYSSYTLWFNFQYGTIPQGPTRTMRRVGDRLEVGGDSFRVVAMDTDAVGEVNTAAFASHPDADERMAPWTLQSEPYDPGLTSGKHNYAFSWWLGDKRGPIDVNYVFDDGSVTRTNGVRPMATDSEAAEQRMARLPIHPSNGHPWRVQVPVQ